MPRKESNDRWMNEEEITDKIRNAEKFYQFS
jgi:hypothetical protein